MAIPINISYKIFKYLGLDLTMHVNNLLRENYKILMKTIETHTHARNYMVLAGKSKSMNSSMKPDPHIIPYKKIKLLWENRGETHV